LPVNRHAEPPAQR